MEEKDGETKEEEKLFGPGWIKLQDSITKLRTNFDSMCDTLSTIIDLETTKLLKTSRVEIHESPQLLALKQRKFIDKLKEKLQGFQEVQLDSSGSDLEYMNLFEKLVERIQESVNGLKEDLCQQLENKTQAEKSLMQENKMLITKNCDLEVELRNTTFQLKKIQADLNVCQLRSEKAEGMIDEKAKKIEQLARQSTVALWEREKQKVLTTIENRENQLENKVNEVTDELDTTKNRLNLRIDELKYQNSLLRTRQSSLTGSISRRQSDEQRRNLFIKERALIIAESELKKQQVYYAGIIQGLSRDFNIMMTKDNRPKEQYELHHRDYVNKMEKIKSAVEDGTMTALRASLPYQYHGVEVIITGSPVKNKSQQKKLFFVDPKTVEVELSEIPVSKKVVKWRSGSNVVTPAMKDLLEDIKNHHPSLVMKNGTLMVNEAKTFFPYFSEKTIRSYFAIFKTLDENGDCSLDTTEILRHIPSLLGRMATTEEVADVVQEIDIDGSGTIDFFEFLLLIRLLEQGEGEANLLRQESQKQKAKLDNDKKTTDSKMCSMM